MASRHISTKNGIDSGAVWGWGYNLPGCLGDSTTNNRWVPVRAKAVQGCVTAVACGDYHSLGLLADGTVLAWGNNEFGVLGRGTTGGWFPQPQPVTGLTGVIAISAAGYLNLALKDDGTVWSWGWNQSGTLGNGSMDPHSAVPVQVANLPVIRKITAGWMNGYAISNTGAAYAWGTAGQGRIGDGDNTVIERRTPVIIPSGLTLPVQIVTGEGGWTAALESGGTVRMWGYNYFRTLGQTSNPENVWTPTLVANVVNVRTLGAGYGTLHATGQFTGVTDATDAPVPAVLALRASPNPSFAATRIAFDLPRPGYVSLAVYDLAGRRVRSLLDETRAAGSYVEGWDGRGESGGVSLAGVYFVRLEAGGERLNQRLVRIR